MRVQNKNLRPNPQNLGDLKPLEPGEISRPVRVRAAAEVHDWLRTMTAAELGALLAEVMHGRRTPSNAAPVPPASKRAAALRPVPERFRRVLIALAGGARVEARPAGFYLVGPPLLLPERVSAEAFASLGRRGWITQERAITDEGRAAAAAFVAAAQGAPAGTLQVLDSH